MDTVAKMLQIVLQLAPDRAKNRILDIAESLDGESDTYAILVLCQILSNGLQLGNWPKGKAN